MSDKRKFPCSKQKSNPHHIKMYTIITTNQLDAFKQYSSNELLKAKLTNYEYNPLHLAICYNANDIVNYIMNNNELKFMMNEIDLNGDTPFHMSIFYQNMHGYEALEKAGATNHPNN
mmetsp:Transcript_534/g.481  ORF Transcript_534/g.481 Transcript_534/m.481 type:complete len:117 (+) Transcript_534:38-388(+)